MGKIQKFALSSCADPVHHVCRSRAKLPISVKGKSQRAEARCPKGQERGWSWRGQYLNINLLQIYYRVCQWKKVWKSVNIWRSYGQEFGVLFFDSQCSHVFRYWTPYACTVNALANCLVDVNFVVKTRLHIIRTELNWTELVDPVTPKHW